VAALTTLAGSLAGGIAGGNAASALAGRQGAKNEVENNSLNTRAAATLMQKLRACAGRCDVAQLSQDIQQQEQYWDKVVAERCGGAGASLAVCASTLNGLQESLSFISSALGMAKTPQERALFLATYNEQVRDINTATAQFEKLGASASVIDVFMTQTALILPDLALSVGGNGRPALTVKPAAGGQSAGVSSPANAPGKVEITIRDHYDHHLSMVNDVKDQLQAQGYRINPKEISFGSSCGNGWCRPDIVAEAPDGTIRIVEIKTGNADLSIRQSEIFPQKKWRFNTTRVGG